MVVFNSAEPTEHAKRPVRVQRVADPVVLVVIWLITRGIIAGVIRLAL